MFYFWIYPLDIKQQSWMLDAHLNEFGPFIKSGRLLDPIFQLKRIFFNRDISLSLISVPKVSQSSAFLQGLHLKCLAHKSKILYFERNAVDSPSCEGVSGLALSGVSAIPV